MRLVIAPVKLSASILTANTYFVVPVSAVAGGVPLRVVVPIMMLLENLSYSKPDMSVFVPGLYVCRKISVGARPPLLAFTVKV